MSTIRAKRPQRREPRKSKHRPSPQGAENERFLEAIEKAERLERPVFVDFRSYRIEIGERVYSSFDYILGRNYRTTIGYYIISGKSIVYTKKITDLRIGYTYRYQRVYFINGECRQLKRTDRIICVYHKVKINNKRTKKTRV